MKRFKHKIISINIREVAAIAANVEGFLLDDEGPFLMSLASRVTGSGVIVEIGSYCGKSTIWLAAGSACASKAPVYAVDHHQGSKEHHEDPEFVSTWDQFQANIRRSGYGDFIVPIRATSEEASREWRQPIELLFVDGGHDEQEVNADLAVWLPYLVPGGVVAFHDSGGAWPGVWRSVKRNVYFGNRFRDILWRQSITAATFDEHQQIAHRLLNSLVFVKRVLQRFNLGRPSLRFWRKVQK